MLISSSWTRICVAPSCVRTTEPVTPAAVTQSPSEEPVATTGTRTEAQEDEGAQEDLAEGPAEAPVVEGDVSQRPAGERVAVGV